MKRMIQNIQIVCGSGERGTSHETSKNKDQCKTVNYKAACHISGLCFKLGLLTSTMAMQNKLDERRNKWHIITKTLY